MTASSEAGTLSYQPAVDATVTSYVDIIDVYLKHTDGTTLGWTQLTIQSSSEAVVPASLDGARVTVMRA